MEPTEDSPARSRRLAEEQLRAALRHKKLTTAEVQEVIGRSAAYRQVMRGHRASGRPLVEVQDIAGHRDVTTEYLPTGEDGDGAAR